MNRSLSYDCPMTLRSVMLQLRDDQIARLDAQAAGMGVSRSKLVRDAVDASLDRPLAVDVAAQYRSAYPDSDGPDGPASDTDAWGDIDAWHEAAARSRRTGERSEPNTW
jgi:Ribbon-helix-helix protein, copG family